MAVVAWVARPFGAAAIGYDSAASVVHFQRLVAGLRLEGGLSTTPKPLLTLVYGSLFAVAPDWRVLAWATILAFGLCLAFAGLLASRLAGPVGAIVAVVGLAGSVGLVGDAALALGTPWAMLLVFAAGLLATGRRPRWTMAGLALAGAALVRPELLLLPAAAVVVGAVRVAGRRSGRFGPPDAAGGRAAWLLGLGLVALPIMLVHDWLLTGNPLYWTTISVLYSSAASHTVRGAGEVAVWLLGHWAAMGAVVVLGVVGVARLVLDRAAVAAAGVLVLWPGLAAVLVLLGARGIFVADRYAIPIDVATLFAAAVGAAELARRLVGAGVERRIGEVTLPGAGTAAAIAVIAVLVTGPTAPFDAGLRATLNTQRLVAENETRTLPAIRSALAALPDAALLPAGAAWTTGHPALIVVPVQVRPRLVAELGLSLRAVASSAGGAIDPGVLPAGASQLVYLDRAAGADVGQLAPLAAGRAAVIGGRSVDPLVADPNAGRWLLLVR